MKVLGLTGGIGMGKSTADQFLRRKGLTVIDADLLARELVEPGQPALAEIERVFGREVIDSEGRLRRDALAAVVFRDPSKRLTLEQILHPRIRARWQGEIRALRDSAGSQDPSREAMGPRALTARSPAVVVVPLLFETDAQGQFDATACVACSAATQFERLRARGWSDGEIGRRMEAQWPIEKKIAAADFVVWTEGSLQAHWDQWERLLAGFG